MATTRNCPFCGKLTDAKLDNCVHCGGFLRGKTGAPEKPEAKKESGERSETCPNCGALVREGEIICKSCHVNLLTGKKVAEEKPLPEAEPSRTPWLVAGIAGAGIVVAALIVLAVFLLRDPVKRAVRYAEEGRVSEATALLEEHVANNPEDGEAYLQLGRMLWASADYISAAAAFDKAFQFNNQEPDAVVFEVLSRARASRTVVTAEQVQALEQLVEARPDYAQGWHLLALARGAMGDATGQIEALNRLAELEPLAPELTAALGIAHARAGNTAEAISTLDAAAAGVEQSADVAAIQGIVLSLEGEADRALPLIEKAVAQGTAYRAEALTQLGLLLLGEGRYDAAQKYLQEVIAARNAPPAATYYYAVSLQAQDLGDVALSEFERLAEDAQNPYSGRAAVRMAQIHLNAGRPEEAVTAVDIAEDREDASRAAVETVRGRVQSANGNVQGAQTAFRAAVGADPAYAPARLELGLWYVSNSDPAQGIRELQRYLELVEPEDPTARAMEVEALIQHLQNSSRAERAGMEGTQ